MNMNKVKLVDLFCGAGGFSTGAVQAGMESVLSIDCWEEALKVHKRNHPNSRHENIMIDEGTKKRIIELIQNEIINLVDGQTLHIHSSPPCQDLSQANIHRTDNTRMTEWVADLMNEISKNDDRISWTIEQVRNNELIDTLKNKDYKPFVNCYYMKNYGICQTRTRMIASNRDFVLQKSKSLSVKKMLNLDDNIKYMLNPFPSTKYGMKCKSVEKEGYTITSKPAHFLDENMNKLRVISIEEMAILQGFSFEYFEEISNKLCLSRKLIGNSVPVHFAKQICEKIIDRNNLFK